MRGAGFQEGKLINGTLRPTELWVAGCTAAPWSWEHGCLGLPLSAASGLCPAVGLVLWAAAIPGMLYKQGPFYSVLTSTVLWLWLYLPVCKENMRNLEFGDWLSILKVWPVPLLSYHVLTHGNSFQGHLL